MGHFAAAKTKSYLDLVSCIEKFRQIPHLDVVVADIGSGPEFDLFYRDAAGTTDCFRRERLVRMARLPVECVSQGRF